MQSEAHTQAPGRWLNALAVFAAVATLVLIGIGGLVTSHGAGMAVPDWPTSYGYNMFFFPISQWIGGIFYEHTHRLVAAFVGLLTSVLACWIWVRETSGRRRWAGVCVILVLVAMLGHRGNREAVGGAANVPMHFKVLAFLMPVLLVFAVVQIIRARGALRWFAMAAFFAVIFQGILGGLRVALYQDQLGIFHATLAQLFLCLLAVIALLTSSAWSNWRKAGVEMAVPALVRMLFAATTVLILLQLILGATMRHQHAGLAIPDFPLAYGKLWPGTDDATLVEINQSRKDVRDFKPITAGQIHLQMAHRAGAVLILLGAILTFWKTRSLDARGAWVKRAATGWLVAVLAQVFLGAFTIWSNKAADVATAHVVLGAASLLIGVVANVFLLKFSVAASPALVHSNRSSATLTDDKTTVAAG